ncbi:hypothetical protein LOZ53_003495 [Ophidiomyces ophidiicola]|nr:hypothetical protein LOZ55_004288 [Ophidiomyces ophidiicola]KAI1988239.1 hypothetical protein LOZ54_003314 [Ophidiomyces ophidiicola]KAI1988932.1 hypothetical protein LOZ51_005322 [Ophidiomyces ophidiicola]KAI1989679.1 hypothetical protein LOZ53_003495 [Ophidiomyces ophidiicola]
MPRHNLRRPIFPSGEDGAFSSVARLDEPQAGPSRNSMTGRAGAPAAHYRSIATGPSGHVFGARGTPIAEDPNSEDAVPFEDDIDLEDEDSEIDEELEENDEGVGDDEDYEMQDDDKNVSLPIPPNLREISSLASWTVSTHKPGCGIAALRHPSPSQFWQSDGPQPHTLTLHFFKRVSVVRIRVCLDFELDESYTPTKMIFLAGMGGNDLVEFATWQGEAPCGWVDIPLEGVGGRQGPQRRRRRRGVKGKDRKPAKLRDENVGAPSANGDADGNNSDCSVISDYDEDDNIFDNNGNLSAGNILKAMVIQVRICENHQNGKDTHLRGFQIFARDETYYARTRRDSGRKLPQTSDGTRKTDDIHTTHESSNETEYGMTLMDESEWFLEPELR